MQMIDVLKRLAELDANNPNIDSGLPKVKSEQAIVVKEDAVAECGMMPEMGAMAPSHPPMPASINITAGSGEELSDMLTTIMTLAGVQKDHEEPAGEMPPPAVATTGADDMRSVIDKLNPEIDGEESEENDEEGDEEETDETVDSMGADPTDTNEFDANQFAHQENQPGQGDRMDGTSPKAYPTMEDAVADLFAQYKNFVREA